MQGWLEAQNEINAKMQELAAKYGTKLVDGAFNWMTPVTNDVHVGASFSFAYNRANNQIWGVQSIDRFIDDEYKSHNEYIDHRESTATRQEILKMFADWVENIPDVINEYKDNISFYEYRANK